MEMVTQVNGFQTITNQKDRFINDFIDLIKSHNPNWLPVTPFASITNNSQNNFKFKQRVEAALNVISGDQNILNYSDRIGLQINTGWASEIVINIRENKNNLIDLRFGIWPGNTKGQGWHMIGQLKKNPNWTPPKQLEINNTVFNVSWGYEIKFCHFNGFITNIILSDKDVKPGRKLISEEVHRKHTGKYIRENWNNLENFLDDYIEPHFNWRKYMNWDKNFLQTNRTYLTMSIGYEIETIVPVQCMQQIDKNIDDLMPLSNFIIEVQKAYSDLFKSK